MGSPNLKDIASTMIAQCHSLMGACLLQCNINSNGGRFACVH
jgi:hypothetical protein